MTNDRPCAIDKTIAVIRNDDIDDLHNHLKESSG